MSMRSSSFSSSTSMSANQQIAISRFVSKTYGWMFLGLLLTGLVGMGIASSESAVQTIMANSWMFFGAMIAEFGLVLWLSARAQSLSKTAATLGFLSYSALNGVTFSLIFLVYTMTSIGQVFMITAGMFGGLALYGTITKKDLTGMGTFVGMGLWGLILVGLANIFIKSESLSMGLSVVTVVVFAGLTAYDAQKIRSMAYASTMNGASEEQEKGAIFGALMLYLNFINLFISLLRLFGSRRE